MNISRILDALTESAVRIRNKTTNEILNDIWYLGHAIQFIDNRTHNRLNSIPNAVHVRRRFETHPM